MSEPRRDFTDKEWSYIRKHLDHLYADENGNVIFPKSLYKKKAENRGNLNDVITDPQDILKTKEYLLRDKREFVSQRNYALFCFGISTGLKNEHLFELCVYDIFDKNGKVFDEFDKVTYWGIEKQSIPPVKITKSLKDILYNYIKERNAIKSLDWSGELFPKRNGGGLHGQYWVRDIKTGHTTEDNNLYKIHVNTMRKTFIYWAIRQHCDNTDIMFSILKSCGYRNKIQHPYHSENYHNHMCTVYQDMEQILNGVQQKEITPEQEQEICNILETLISRTGRGDSEQDVIDLYLLTVGLK